MVNSLPLKDFKKVVQYAPLFSIDLVVINKANQILVGERLNAPAKGFWFVPGGRVYKNESLEQAFKRISKAELGLEIERHKANLLGLYEHFYDDSFFDNQTSTHYINAAHYLRVSEKQLKLPTEQHNQYRWVGIEAIEENLTIHANSKIFLNVLRAQLND